MANRIIYQSDALCASSGVKAKQDTAHKQLKRIQSANYSFNVNRTDVNQFGNLARIDSTILETPTVSVDLTYLLGDGFNELALGFSESSGSHSSALTGFIANQISATSEQGTSGINLYVLTTPEGKDANTARAEETADYSVIGLGNCYLSDYTLDASVGDFPTVTVSLEGLNANSTTAVSGITGARNADGAITHSASAGTVTGFRKISGVGVNVVDGTQLSDFNPGAGPGSAAVQTINYNTTGSVHLPATAADATIGTDLIALKPGDMSLTLTNDKSFFDIGTSTDAGHIQSVSLNIPLSRTPIEKLGSTFAFARVADFPITPTLSVSAVVNTNQQQALHQIIGDDGFIDELNVKFNNGAGVLQAGYTLKNAKVESESVSSSIGPNKTVDLTFSLTIGGPDDETNNVFFSGSSIAQNSRILGLFPPSA